MKRYRRLFRVATLATALLSSKAAFADSLTWTGAVNNLWNTADANWAGGKVFANGDTVLFSGTNGTITSIVSRSPGTTTVDSNNKVTFATGIMNAGNTKAIGGLSILTGALVKNGIGELELGDPSLGQQFGTDSNKYSNSFSSVTVNAGTLRIRSRAALGTGTVTLAGGSSFIQASEEGRFNTGNEQIDNNFVLSGGLVNFPMAFGNDNKGSWFRNGVVSGPGGIKVTGSSRSLALSGNNTFSGGVTLDAASIIIASYKALGTGTFTANQSLLTTGADGLRAGIDLPGNATYPNGVTNPFVINSGKYLNLHCDTATASLRLSGNITGAGGLNKWKNASKVILSGNNSYSGGTIIASGTLVCESENSLGGGSLAIAAGAMLQLDFIGSSDVTSLTLGGGPALPNGTYGSSSSPAENRNDVYFAGLGMITVGPPKAPTTTALARTGGSNPSPIGQPVTLTATVNGGTPTGTVVFYDGLSELGRSTLNGSFQASIVTTALPAGARNVLAQYQGNATYASSSSPLLPITVTDSRPATTTTLALTTGTNPASAGTSLAFTATVTGASPTGQVSFYDRDNLLGSVALNGSFQASITGSLPAGLRPITARYAGDVNNKPSSDVYDQNVDPPAGNGKLKVFLLAGQSNMQGHGSRENGRNPENPTGPLIVGGLGSLRNVTTREPLKYGYLLDPNNPVNGLPGWRSRGDVYISYWDEVGGTTTVKRAGYLDPGFGVGGSMADGRLGPEYGFGVVAGSALGDEVLLIKTAWGGKSLKTDFRPPSSGGTVGPYYQLMVQKARLVLNNLATYYPGYDGNGYELSGFGWHQGWNDRVDASAVAEYEVNLTNLIKDLRIEFGVPKLPVVIANTGMASAPSGPGTLIQAQANVSNPVLHPEFAGTVATVDTRPFDYGEFQSPTNQGYHWHGNGQSYFQIGESMGEAMMALLQTPYQAWAGNPAQGLTGGVNDDPSDDPDFDGIVNLLEFVLRGDPLSRDTGILPDLVSPGAGTWRFEYDRNKDSSPGVTQIVEYTDDLAIWTKVTIPQSTSGSVTITSGTTTDHVSVAIPPLGPSGFVRLSVSE